MLKGKNLRITVEGTKVHLSTGEYIDPDRWDQAGCVKGRGRGASLSNGWLDKIPILNHKISKVKNDAFPFIYRVTFKIIPMT